MMPIRCNGRKEHSKQQVTNAEYFMVIFRSLCIQKGILKKGYFASKKCQRWYILVYFMDIEDNFSISTTPFKGLHKYDLNIRDLFRYIIMGNVIF